MSNKIGLNGKPLEDWQPLRVVHFRPYGRGENPDYPSFKLALWDTGRFDHHGKFIVGYRLTKRHHRRTTVLFEGEDFATSDAIDGDGAVAGLMGFLTLRKGDTDPEYFSRYTAEQLEFSEQHAETLAVHVMDRFPE